MMANKAAVTDLLSVETVTSADADTGGALFGRAVALGFPQREGEATS